jgi:hypothetical protein
MSTFYYPGPALDFELAHRRSALLRDAATHRLARQARHAARTDSPAAIPRSVGSHPAAAGPARDQVTRAA